MKDERTLAHRLDELPSNDPTNPAHRLADDLRRGRIPGYAADDVRAVLQALRSQPSVEAIRAILENTVDWELCGPFDESAKIAPETLDEAARQITELYKGEGG